MRPVPDHSVLGWLDAENLYLSTASLAELWLGIESLPAGKRRRALLTALDEQIVALFAERIVPFDSRAAEAYPRIVTSARRRDYPITVADARDCRLTRVQRCDPRRRAIPRCRRSRYQPLGDARRQAGPSLSRGSLQGGPVGDGQTTSLNSQQK